MNKRTIKKNEDTAGKFGQLQRNTIMKAVQYSTKQTRTRVEQSLPEIILKMPSKGQLILWRQKLKSLQGVHAGHDI